MIDKELIGATTTSITLSILRQGDSYGYEIIQRVTELTSGKLEWTEAMLYQVLHRMEDSQLVRSYWQKSSSGRRRKYYSITEAGVAALEDKERQWRIIADLMRRLWSRNT